MSSVYTPPTSQVEIEHKTDPGTVIRPLAVTVVGWIFIALAFIDLYFRFKNGFFEASNIPSPDGAISTSSVQLLWLLLYGIGAGLMRRGKFARAMACLFGLIALLIPGLTLIYLFYFSKAKNYFDSKECPKCYNHKWKNIQIAYRKQQCKVCGWSVVVKNKE